MSRIFCVVSLFAIFALLPDANSQDLAGTVVSSVNLTADARTQSFVASTAYAPHDILANRYTVDNLAPGYQVLIQGVALIENLDGHDGTIDILVVNSSPFCGSPYGLPPFGPGRVITVTVPAGRIASIPISMVTWGSAGVTTTAHLQYRHASPFLKVMKNSSLDVIMLPAAKRPVTASPTEGLPLRPDDCP